MNASKFRFTFAVVLVGLLSAAGVAGLAGSMAAADSACPCKPRSVEIGADSSGTTSGGDQAEVRWSSLIPGSFK